MEIDVECGPVYVATRHSDEDPTTEAPGLSEQYHCGAPPYPPSMQGNATQGWRQIVGDVCWGIASAATPLVMGFAAVVYMTQAGYMVCSGSEVVATSYRYMQIFWLWALPIICWAVCVGSDWRWHTGRVELSQGERLVRRFLFSLLPIMIYFWYSVRYFNLDANGCIDGLPPWWPPFLPAR